MTMALKLVKLFNFPCCINNKTSYPFDFFYPYPSWVAGLRWQPHTRRMSVLMPVFVLGVLTHSFLRHLVTGFLSSLYFCTPQHSQTYPTSCSTWTTIISIGKALMSESSTACVLRRSRAFSAQLPPTPLPQFCCPLACSSHSPAGLQAASPRSLRIAPHTHLLHLYHSAHPGNRGPWPGPA